MGAAIFGEGRLLTANCVISIGVSATVIVEGRTTETFTVINAAVPVLATLFSGGRTANFGTDAERTDLIIRGVHALLKRDDVRYLIVSHESMPEIVGKYLRVKSPQSHPAGEGGLQVATSRCECNFIDLPAVIA